MHGDPGHPRRRREDPRGLVVLGAKRSLIQEHRFGPRRLGQLHDGPVVEEEAVGRVLDAPPPAPPGHA
eukprot:10210614-Lingulodinium_polyedra.AAC.1